MAGLSAQEARRRRARPLCQARPGRDADFVSADEAAAPTPSVDAIHVLLVEDDKDQRLSLSALIRIKGYSVMTAADGYEALQKLREHGPPSVVLLDLRMPHMSGRELRYEMLKDDRLAIIPVVLLSAESDLENEAKNLGVADYLAKPPNLDRLFSLLAKHCSAGEH